MKVSAALVRRRRRLRCAVTVATAAALVVGASGVATAAVSGVDVASYQHPNDASINWDAVHNSGGQTFAMVKATEGNTGDYVNPYFQADARAVKSAGMYLSTYHYARPSVGGGDRYASAADQARNFVHTIGSDAEAGNLPPTLDLEESGGLGSADLVAWVHRFLDTVEQLTHRVPMIYTGKWFWNGSMGGSTEFTRYPLWAAQYNDAIASPDMFGGWSSWTFWQYTSTGRVAGISAPVDLNRFRGDTGELATLAGGGGAVTSAGQISIPDLADLQVTVEAPFNVTPGQSFQATLTVTNHGPVSAASTTASLVPYGSLTAVNRGSGRAVGPSTDFTTPVLQAGQSKSYVITMTAAGNIGALLAFAPPKTLDPNPFNNFAVAPVVNF